MYFCIAIVACARVVAAYDEESASTKVADVHEMGTIVKQISSKLRFAVTIESEKATEQEDFERRLDDTAKFLCFRQKEDEE